MSSLRHPVGPQPPSVYWRRRAVVGLGVLAVIVVIVLIVVRPGTAEPTGAGTPGPAATDSAEVDGDGSGEGDEQSDLDAAADEAAAEGGGAPQACTSEQVQVTPITDAESYGPESQPQLSLSLLNTGTRPCIIEAGSDVQEFLITSGPDRIWSSRDCQVDPVAATVVLEPGEERSTPAIPWNRTRSEPGVCDVQRTPVPGGGATYRLSVSVGEFAGDGDRPFLLN
ncbi:MAG: hypothetical protein ACXIUP_05600 [Microcella sp.]